MELNLSVGELCNLLNINPLPGSEQTLLRRITSLEQADQNDCSVILERGDASVFESINTDIIKKSRAGFILAREAITQDKQFLIVEDMHKALAQLHTFLNQRAESSTVSAEIDPSAQIHPSAIIGTNTVIEENAIIGPFVIIGKGCRIGAHTKIHAHVSLLDYCTIGQYSIVHSGAVIGSDGFGYSVSKKGLLKNPHFGAVKIGNHVEIGAQCAIDRALFDDTVIEDGVKLDNLIHIAHNVYIGAGTAILALTGIAGGAQIGQGCQIGGQVAIKDHVIIGDNTKIVSKSAVINNISPNSIIAGQPAESFTQWKRKLIALKKLPEALKLLPQKKSKNFLKTFMQRWLNR